MWSFYTYRMQIKRSLSMFKMYVIRIILFGTHSSKVEIKNK